MIAAGLWRSEWDLLKHSSPQGEGRRGLRVGECHGERAGLDDPPAGWSSAHGPGPLPLSIGAFAIGAPSFIAATGAQGDFAAFEGEQIRSRVREDVVGMKGAERLGSQAHHFGDRCGREGKDENSPEDPLSSPVRAGSGWVPAHERNVRPPERSSKRKAC